MYEPFGLCGCLCTHFQCGCDKNMVMTMTVVIFRSALGSAFIFIALTTVVTATSTWHHQQQYQQEHGHGHPHHVFDRGQLSVLSPSPKNSYSAFIEQYMYVHIYIYTHSYTCTIHCTIACALGSCSPSRFYSSKPSLPPQSLEEDFIGLLQSPSGCVGLMRGL